MIELLQFRHSPYNEKVRWALDLKGVPHSRRSLLPGPHLVTVRRLTGRTSTPVLIVDGSPIDGSARILEWLDAHHPVPALLPADPAQRREALRIQSMFDDDLTPRIRRVVLDTLLREPASFAAVFAEALPGWKRRLYALSVPLAAPAIRKGNGIAGRSSLQDGERAIEQALDFVARRAQRGDLLVGESLSVADLAAASTLAVLGCPENSPMACPPAAGPAFKAMVARHASHPAIAWVRRVYAAHRGARADFEGVSTPARG
jgi:glutathione S-transferase